MIIRIFLFFFIGTLFYFFYIFLLRICEVLNIFDFNYPKIDNSPLSVQIREFFLTANIVTLPLRYSLYGRITLYICENDPVSSFDYFKIFVIIDKEIIKLISQEAYEDIQAFHEVLDQIFKGVGDTSDSKTKDLNLLNNNENSSEQITKSSINKK